MTTPISSSQPNTGRSPVADLIYIQYINYFNDINTKVHALDQLSGDKRNQANVIKDRAQLVTLQQQLYPIYISQYGNSNATVDSFKTAVASIENSVLTAYNDAMSIPTPLPTVPTTPPLPTPIDTYTNNQPTPTTTPTPTPSPTPPVITPVITPTTASGRSPEASQIYNQYLTYYNDINTKITLLDQLPYNQRTQANVILDRAKIVSLQKDLYTLYTNQYNNSNATLSTFQSAYAVIQNNIALAINDATNTSSTTPVTPPVTTNPAPTPTPTATPPPTTTPTPTTPVTPVAPVTTGTAPPVNVVNSTWYLTWTSWDYPIPDGVKLVDIFVGNMRVDSSGNPVIDGFGTMSQNISLMDNFIKACHAKGIAVKMSLGGGGGSYDNCWNVLTNSNVAGFAQALANFCYLHGADGIDFDVENFTSAQDRPAQQALVGMLIKDFKNINPNFQTSLCTNAGFGPYYPWPGIVQNILNAATTTALATNKKTCALDRLYIMSYFNSLSDEQGWINGWADMMKTNYGFTPAQITVGLNSETTSYDVNAFAKWAGSKGFSTAVWPYNPAISAQSNQLTNSVLNAYKS
ncbi:MAG: hypothetical protein H0W88_05690 [Parachlamydiaceae bacterium]|nr:hypothetical protein [Parachlamydiaceae bacterium]